MANLQSGVSPAIEEVESLPTVILAPAAVVERR
jgi:hypothetical protein